MTDSQVTGTATRESSSTRGLFDPDVSSNQSIQIVQIMFVVVWSAPLLVFIAEVLTSSIYWSPISRYVASMPLLWNLLGYGGWNGLNVAQGIPLSTMGILGLTLYWAILGGVVTRRFLLAGLCAIAMYVVTVALNAWTLMQHVGLGAVFEDLSYVFGIWSWVTRGWSFGIIFTGAVCLLVGWTVRKNPMAITGTPRVVQPQVAYTQQPTVTTSPFPTGMSDPTSPQAFGQQPFPVQPTMGTTPATVYGAMPAPYASWAQRLGALIIDNFVVLLLCSAVIIATALSVSAAMGADGGPVAFVVWYLDVGLGASAYMLSGAAHGQTVGKRALGIRVVRENGERLGFWLSFGRMLGSIISSLVLYIGWLAPLWTPKKQTWHDQMAGTVVIHDKSKLSVNRPIFWAVFWTLVTSLAMSILFANIFQKGWDSNVYYDDYYYYDDGWGYGD